jgi:hypothetical protein
LSRRDWIDNTGVIAGGIGLNDTHDSARGGASLSQSGDPVRHDASFGIATIGEVLAAAVKGVWHPTGE